MMKNILLLAILLAGSASAQSLFNVPIQPPEMAPGYGAEGKGLHTAVPYGQPGPDCVINPVSMTFSYMTVEKTELVAGQVFSIPVNVLFDFDGDVVRPEGHEALGEFYQAIVEGGATEVLVVGHTDAKGTEEYNLDLGLRRAAAVALVLSQLGFENIDIDSAGESLPVAPNSFDDGTDNPEGRQLNRRVDIEIVAVADQEVVTTEVVKRRKNPQIFHRIAADHTVACGGGGGQPAVGIAVDSRRLAPAGGVVITVPR